MVNDKVDFDFGADFADNNYKSCFARSIAVTSSLSQKHISKSLQHSSGAAGAVLVPVVNNIGGVHYNGDLNSKGGEQLQDSVVVSLQGGGMIGDTIVKMRKPLCISSEDNRRYSCNSGSAGSRRTSICSSRITEVPDVETVLLQSQVDTLQWQLKQTLESRKMYRNVMKQVVTFLDRTHRNLQVLGKKTHQQPSTVARSKSEHHVNGYHSREASISSATLPTDCADYESISDYSWRQSRKADSPSPDEIPPEKLSQEAFRLLRTVQSLLNTREPDLTPPIEPPNHPHTATSPTPSDIDFLVQLAKEFPSSEPPIASHRTPNRTTSFSLSPKLLTPEKDNPNNLHRLATAFNRKLSLQLGDANYSKAVCLTARTDSPLMTSAILDDAKMAATYKFAPEKSNSPPVSTVSSVEDESGFSSMNSFQEVVGVPVVMADDPKMALLKSMLHSDDDERGNNMVLESKNLGADVSLWRFNNGNTGAHKRWSSNPVDSSSEKQGLKVLWV